MLISRSSVAEALGTFFIVLVGCGYSVLAQYSPLWGGEAGGVLSRALVFGMATTMACWIPNTARIGHFNPAITLGFWLAGRHEGRAVLPYLVGQVAGGLLAGGVICCMMESVPGFLVDPMAAAQFASNGFGTFSPGGYSARAAFITEMLAAGMIMLVYMAATDRRRCVAGAPLLIGAIVALVHLFSWPVTLASANPARSTGVAIFAHMDAVKQLWLFWLAPALGASGAAHLHGCLLGNALDEEC